MACFFDSQCTVAAPIQDDLEPRDEKPHQGAKNLSLQKLTRYLFVILDTTHVLRFPFYQMFSTRTDFLFHLAALLQKYRLYSAVVMYRFLAI